MPRFVLHMGLHPKRGTPHYMCKKKDEQKQCCKSFITNKISGGNISQAQRKSTHQPQGRGLCLLTFRKCASAIIYIPTKIKMATIEETRNKADARPSVYFGLTV